MSAHALLALADQVDGDEPLPQGQVGAVHDRTGHHAEAMAAPLAPPLPAAGYFADIGITAFKTRDARGPADGFKQVSALGVRVVAIHQ